MPLNWNAESVKDWDDLPDYKYQVIDHTMNIGLGQIRKDNVDRWCDRARFMRLVYGPMLWIDKEYRDDDKDYHPLEDREFIGKLVGLLCVRLEEIIFKTCQRGSNCFFIFQNN